jgi:lysyl-tRNA synthetase class 2
MRNQSVSLDAWAPQYAPGQPVELVGRVLGIAGNIVTLQDAEHRCVAKLHGAVDEGLLGAWVRAVGRWSGAALEDCEIMCLQRTELSPSKWWACTLPEARVLEAPGRIAVLRSRSRLLSHVRRFFESRGFLEVQTPVLRESPEACHVAQLSTRAYGGRKLYLRTDPEEYLKRHLTAGIEAVFEVSVNFRAEQADRTHLQEFSSVEGYHRCWRFENAMAICEELVRDCTLRLTGGRSGTLNGRVVSLAGQLPRMTFRDLVLTHSGIDVDAHTSVDALAAAVRKAYGFAGVGGPLDRYRRTALEWLFDKWVAPAIAEPIFVTDFPEDLGLSGRAKDGEPLHALRGELYLPGGFELAHFYENLTDPKGLRERYSRRRAHRIAAGMSEVPLDEALMESARLGMPPMSGFAIGLDRLLMVALGASEVGTGLLFPREGFDADDQEAHIDSTQEIEA